MFTLSFQNQTIKVKQNLYLMFIVLNVYVVTKWLSAIAIRVN